MARFLVVGLPRSRTAWLAELLGCRHEPSLAWSTIDDAYAYFAGADAGASDCMQTFLVHELKARYPDLRIVLVKRPRAEVVASLDALVGRVKFVAPPWLIDCFERRMAEIERDLNPLVVEFEDLNDASIVAGVYAYCTDTPLDRARYESLRHRNVQSDVTATAATIKLRNAELGRLFGPRYGDVLIGWSTIDQCLALGLAEHLDRQWRESGIDHEAAPLAMNWDEYRRKERDGALRLLAVMRRGELIGYGSYFMLCHMNFSRSLMVVNDSIYVDHAHRGLASRMVRWVERFFAETIKPFPSVRIFYAAPDPRWAAVLTRLGYPQIETTHRKVVMAV